jgi:hypothetical protein
MIKNVFGVLIALSLIAFSGCEDEDKDESTDTVEYEVHLFNATGIVKYRVVSSDPNIIMQVVTYDNQCLLIGYDTEILIEDHHRDRLKPASVDRIHAGNRIDYYYYMSNVNHSVNPVTYYIERIIIYRDDSTNSITY